MEAATTERKRRVKKDAEAIVKYNAVIARNVLFFRNERGWSQDDLETLSGLAKANISRIENGKYGRRINDDFVAILANTFKLDPDAITETNEDITNRIHALTQASKQWPIGEETLEEAERLRNDIQDRGPKEMAQVYMILGHIEYAHWRVSRALEYYEESYRLAIQTNEPLLIQKSRYNLSLILIASGRYERAETYMKESLNEAFDDERRARALNSLGYLYYSQGDFDKAEYYYSEVQKYKLCDSGLLVTLQSHQGMGDIYRLKGDFKKAKECIDQALKIARDRNDGIGILYSYKTLSEILDDSGDIEKSLSYLKQAKSVAVSIHRNYESALIDFHLCLRLKDYEGMIHATYQITEMDAPPSELAEIYEIIAYEARAQGRMNDAFEYLEKHVTMLKRK
ncbi:hypothetical protein CIG75_12990 [Tumebacillus algifaecis]|uniref:HTH cro/C1-type domain-containing protein n=1 Tax=Tumebacillus algifaecis TaxID=1214604 RepID=A0A223D2T6_9BACL|nr:tetratricopeptide repeat protein [Tumebacillus algifaecis]ASS75815.1 hypothetical protein CIG75_12990 [Tumebacillus algifaecis]